MERLGAWLWREQRRRFVLMGGVTATAILVPLLLLPATTVGAVYLDLTLVGALAWGGTALGGVVVGLLVATMRLGARARGLAAWIAGDESDPVAAWRDLLWLPQALGTRVFTIVLPLAAAVSLPVAVHVAEPSTAGMVGLVVACGVVAVAGHLLATAVGQLLVGHAAADVASTFGPVDVEESPTWTVRRRLLLATFVGACFAASGTPLLVYGTSTTQGDYAAFLVFGSLFAIYLCWVLDVGVFRPTLAPVRALVAGMVRVRRGDLEQAVPVTSPDEIGTLSAAFNEMLLGLRQREALHAAFGAYVDPALAQRIVDSGSAQFEGQDVVVTVLFADLRDFTAYAETVEPAEAVARLNALFDVIVPVVHEHGGHANHYLGDGLLAVFGAPQPLVRHANAAVAAATEMQRRVRATLGRSLRLGIGINTGPVIAGTVGGGGRHEFTVIGDAVNVGARVEQLTKETGDAILITDATRAALDPPRPRCTPRGAFALKGKASQVTVHAVSPTARRRGSVLPKLAESATGDGDSSVGRRRLGPHLEGPATAPGPTGRRGDGSPADAPTGSSWRAPSSPRCWARSTLLELVLPKPRRCADRCSTSGSRPPRRTASTATRARCCRRPASRTPPAR